MSDQITDTLREFENLAFTPEFEIDKIISRRGVVHGFSKIKQGFHPLARQHEADPYTEQQCEPRNYAQHPFRAMKVCA